MPATGSSVPNRLNAGFFHPWRIPLTLQSGKTLFPLTLRSFTQQSFVHSLREPHPVVALVFTPRTTSCGFAGYLQYLSVIARSFATRQSQFLAKNDTLLLRVSMYKIKKGAEAPFIYIKHIVLRNLSYKLFHRAG